RIEEMTEDLSCAGAKHDGEETVAGRARQIAHGLLLRRLGTVLQITRTPSWDQVGGVFRSWPPSRAPRNRRPAFRSACRGPGTPCTSRHRARRGLARGRWLCQRTPPAADLCEWGSPARCGAAVTIAGSADRCNPGPPPVWPARRG